MAMFFKNPVTQAECFTAIHSKPAAIALLFFRYDSKERINVGDEILIRFEASRTLGLIAFTKLPTNYSSLLLKFNFFFFCFSLFRD